MDSNEINVYKAALKKAADKINELDAKLKEATSQQEIAVIGYDCRFPAGANSPALFWERLEKGFDAVTPIKDKRFKTAPYFKNDSEEKGGIATQYASFLDFDVRAFDNTHFEISPIEAASIDPQQRLLLEVSWGALENAGIEIEKLKNSKTGVFIGIDATDYVANELVSGNVEDITPYTLIGVSSHAAAGRLSYFYDLKGPAACVSTACSSSLTALNMAVESLKNGQCDLAIVGGVSLMLNPEPYIGLSQIHALSPDGKCKTFDALADGFGRGEGCGIVILKKAQDARRDGNTIEAIVKEVYMGHDGKSNGFYAPNGLAEERIIKEALRSANLSPDDIDYIEAHGTGTSLGDFIEAQAVCDAYKDRKKPIKIGSVKSNMGHLEAAAGMASMIKVLLSLKHKQLPPSIHFETPNPNIDWNRIQVVSTLTDWEAKGRKRRAGINAFGISGTLVHVIMEEAPEAEQQEQPIMPASLITLSVKNKVALDDDVKKMCEFIETSSETLHDIAYTTNTTREKNEYRFAVVGTEKEQVLEEMKLALENEEARTYCTGKADEKKSKIAFLFTGQGSIYKEVGKQFYKYSKEYRECFDLCDKRFQELLGISVKDAVFQEEADLTTALYSQAVIFSLEYSLTKIWDTMHVKPDYVIGHSVGEYAALCYSGMLPFEEATRMIALRSKMMMTVKPNGKMAGILATKEMLEEAIVESGCTHVSIGAENAVRNVTLSGLREEVDKVISVLQSKNRVFVNELGILYPYHSIAMKEYSKVYADSLDTLICNKGNIKVISTVTGKQESYETFAKKEYWIEHLEKTVYFMKAIKEAERLGVTKFIEIGGNATLCGLAGQNVSTDGAVFVPTMRNTIDDYKQLLESLKQLYLGGMDLDFAGLLSGYKTKKVSLPNYSLKKQVYWRERQNTERNSGGKRTNKVDASTLSQLLQQQNKELEKQQQLLNHYLKKK